MAGSPDLRELLAGPVLEVAPRLLGAELRHGDVALRLTEVEAYDGANDAGSHAYRGRTRRNAVMFGPPGHLYCYFTYGMHVCCNVVTGTEGGRARCCSARGRWWPDWRSPGRADRAPRTGTWPADRPGCAGPWASTSTTTGRPGRGAGHPRAAGRAGHRGLDRTSGGAARRPGPALAVLADRRPDRVGLPSRGRAAKRP